MMNDVISRQAAIDYCYQLINVEHQQGSDEMNYGQERVNQTETILHHLEFMPSAQPERKTGRWISEQDMADKLTRLINEFEMILSDIREKEVDDSVCGLCEYDADHGMDGYANECPGYEKDDCFRLKDEYRKQWMSMKC